jgi:DNA polymerase-3 subunit gamma/tau
MPYISLYRKYRPQRFADVAGQEHVVQTLQNALRTGRIANGYLFCGTRGVAKTTIARIFAKCLSCIGPDGDRTAPSPEPCNDCKPCRTISAGQCVDVIEMDAASNRSVNDMARIRENVQFGPMENRFKTFIVDEAHQLSSDAKDAFLKTLEEPPAGVVFILATTESHAIPVTIASRCQQFDFKRGSIDTISQQVELVLGREGVEMSSDAIAGIARAAEGSYRDALSLLEQVLAYKRTDVSAKDVAEVLGAVDTEVIATVVAMIAKSDAAQAFALAERVFTDGRDTRQFFKSVAARFRDLLYLSVGAQVAGESGILGDSKQLAKEAQLFTPYQMLRAMEVLADAERETKFVTQHRLLLEMTLLRLIEVPASAAAAPAASEPAAPAARKATAAPSIPAPQPAPPAALRPAPAAPSPVPPAVAIEEGDGSEQIEFLRTHWQSVINHVQARSKGGVRVISDAIPLRMEETVITLGFQSKAYLDMFDGPSRRKFIEDVICKVLRAEPDTYKVRGVLISNVGKEARAVEPPPPPVQSQKSAVETPLLDEVISIFGGNIIDEE